MQYPSPLTETRKKFTLRLFSSNLRMEKATPRYARTTKRKVSHTARRQQRWIVTYPTRDPTHSIRSSHVLPQVRSTHQANPTANSITVLANTIDS